MPIDNSIISDASLHLAMHSNVNAVSEQSHNLGRMSTTMASR